jgi:ribonucleoside-diphosphate reductase alpha chain
VRQYGMRNSNVMAIAPTATIANIAGVFPSIEPIYKNIYVKTNMSGEFTVVNNYLMDDLKALGLWNNDMLELLKYYDGNLQMIEQIPQVLKDKYQEAFEIDPVHLINITAVRGKWLDQSISHNVFMKGVSGKMLNDIYMTAWKAGLKTMYYLRTLGASQIEKASLDANKFGFTQKRIYKSMDSSAVAETPQVQQEDAVTLEEDIIAGVSCNISDNPECDVCQ